MSSTITPLLYASVELTMGELLSKPVTKKESSDCEGRHVRVGASSMQGWREYQEDAHSCVLEFDRDVSLFAVYDGFNGHEVAEYCSRHLPLIIKQTRSYKKGDYKNALKEAFLELDSTLTTEAVKAELRRIRNCRKKADKEYTNWSESNSDDENPSQREEGTMKPGWDSGCAAVVVLLVGWDLYVASAGDSRCVVCREHEAMALTSDHCPRAEAEYHRITAAGGRVDREGRVDGDLNLSRAIGAHRYKQVTTLSPSEQKISAMPDVNHLAIKPGVDRFMILACDGIWSSKNKDVKLMDNQKAVGFVFQKLSQKPQRISLICEELLDLCLAKESPDICDDIGHDNMTCIIIQFKNI